MIRHKLSKIPYKARRFLGSIFTKLILINLAAWFLILLAVAFTFFFSRYGEKGPFYRNITQYLQYILDDLGTPPQKENGIRIYHKTGVHISFSGKKERWTTREHFPAIEKIHFRSFHGSNKLHFNRKNGHHLLRLQIDNGTLYFEVAGGAEKYHQQKQTHLLLLLLLSLIVFACYFALKKLLFPLKTLEIGVAEAAKGNLTHQVPVRGNNELAELAHRFNEMTLQLDKMIKTKEHLLRDISHELRSPLTRMKVELEFIDNSEAKAGIQQDILEMEKMITAILESARDHHNPQNQVVSRCNLDQILTKMATKYRNMPPGVQYDADNEGLSCMADKDALQRIFSNLIDNSIKFSASQQRAVQLQFRRKNNNALITVRDYGQGIEAEELPYIFETFYRVDKSRSRRTGGFGLGLSLCKALTEAYGGRIEVQSSVGQGTTFYVTFPLAGN